MKHFFVFITIIFVMSLSGCSKDEPVAAEPLAKEKPVPPNENPEEPKSLIYFSYTGQNNSSSSEIQQTSWAILHDDKGELIDYKKIEPGVTLEFETFEDPVINNFTVTFLKSRRYANGDIASYIDSYEGIEKGADWNEYAYIQREQKGSFDFFMSAVPDWNTYTIRSTDSYGAVGDFETYEFLNQNADEGNLRVDDVVMFEENNFIFILTDDYGVSKYAMLPNVMNGDSVALDASRLLEFDTTTRIDLPPHNRISFGISALSEEDGVQKSFYLSPTFILPKTPLEVLELGYLDDYTEYQTDMYLQTDEYDYFYIKTGAPLQSFEFPVAPNFDIIDSSPMKFSFETNADFKYQVNNFTAKEPAADGGFSRNTTIWTNTARPHGFKSLVNIPDDLLEESGVYVENMEYLSTTLLTKSEEYSKKVNSKFNISIEGTIEHSETESFTFHMSKDGAAKRVREPKSLAPTPFVLKGL